MLVQFAGVCCLWGSKRCPLTLSLVASSSRLVLSHPFLFPPFYPLSVLFTSVGSGARVKGDICCTASEFGLIGCAQVLGVCS